MNPLLIVKSQIKWAVATNHVVIEVATLDREIQALKSPGGDGIRRTRLTISGIIIYIYIYMYVFQYIYICIVLYVIVYIYICYTWYLTVDTLHVVCIVFAHSTYVYIYICVCLHPCKYTWYVHYITAHR
jgi:hypothetical protein